MKKKILFGISAGIMFITAMVLLIGFNAPVFYNTDYSISESGFLCGYIRIVDGHTVEYYEDETDTEPMVYKCEISGDTLTFGRYTFKIQSKFKLVWTSNSNCTATPAGGGGDSIYTFNVAQHSRRHNPMYNARYVDKPKAKIQK